jgi:hypothetical protein
MQQKNNVNGFLLNFDFILTKSKIMNVRKQPKPIQIEIYNIFLFLFYVLAPACTTVTYYKQDGSSACGFFLAQGLTWAQANASCSAAGARLPVIVSDQENRDLFNILVQSSFLVVIYISYNNKFPKTF